MLSYFSLLNLCLLISLVAFFFIEPDLLSFLMLSELIWVIFYCFSAFLGISVDSFYLLGLCVAILVFAGLEFSIGLLLYYFF